MEVPDAVGAGEATVRRTRQKYERGGVEAALFDAERPGQPRAISDRQATEVIAMVCGSPPAGRARWTIELIWQEARRRGLVGDVSTEPIRLLLRDHGMKPWREKNVVCGGVE